MLCNKIEIQIRALYAINRDKNIQIRTFRANKNGQL